MIEVKNLSVKMNGISIISDMNYKFKSDKKYIISGISGCGKSTFLYSICNLQKIDSGSIEIFGKSHKNKQARNNLSIVFQNLLLDQRLSIIDNISCTIDNVDHNKVIELMKYFNINKNLNVKVNQLSGGQQQRIAIIRELIRDRKILLFDEPTSHLDKKNRNLFYDMINSFENKLVIIITHEEDDEKKESYTKLKFNDLKVE